MKTKILMALKETDGYVSGQELCEKFGVSRTAVWKVMEKLKEEGYEIESVRNRGYRLVHAPDIFSAEEIETRVHTKVIGRRVLFFDELESTNVYCKQHGEELENGTLVVAEAQDAGKGSRGRGWQSPGGVAIYMSVLLKPDIPPMHAPRLTLVMALSVVRALRGMGIEAQIKWPNDVVINGKKLVGILTEMSSEVDYIHHVVIGVGINVLTPYFPEEIAQRATSLYIETGRRYSRAALTAAVMDCFEKDYEAFLQTEDLSQLLEQYRQFSATIGRDVRILARGNEYTAKALDVDKDGQLLVEKENGERVKVFADEVSVRGIYGYV